MARIEGSVEIAAPRQAVWDLLADPSRHTEFGTFVAEVRLVTEGEVREGTVYRERSGPAFMKSWSEWTVTRFDPPRELVHASKEKPMTAVGTWTLTEVGSGSTRVTQVLDSQLMPRFPNPRAAARCGVREDGAERDGSDAARHQTNSRRRTFGILDVIAFRPASEALVILTRPCHPGRGRRVSALSIRPLRSTNTSSAPFTMTSVTFVKDPSRRPAQFRTSWRAKRTPADSPAPTTNHASRGFISHMDEHPAPVAQSIPEGASIVSELLSFESFFDREARTLFRRLYAVTGDAGEAEEIMQDAFLALWERWERVGAMDDPTGYLYRTAMNVFRKRGRRAALAIRKRLALASDAPPFADIEAQQDAVAALRTLSPRQRAAVVLLDVLDYSSEQAGQALGVTAGTARGLASRARDTLRQQMVEEA